MTCCATWWRQPGEAGYERLEVDFASANILAGRSWLRYFAPVCYSLVRPVDDRMAWAHEHRSGQSSW